MKFDVTEWCNDNLENPKPTSTNQIVADCPWCGKSNHLYIDREEGHFICFSCNNAGKYLVGLISQVEGISFSEAKRYVMRHRVEFRRKHAPKTLLEKITESKKVCTGRIEQKLPEEFIPVYKSGKWSFPVYLRERGIKRSTAKQWNLGWARRGRYGGRIIFPINCPMGSSFTTRDVTGHQKPKYLNPKGIDNSHLLFGWDNHFIKGDVVLVEGPMDAIKMWQHGFPSLALMGKVLYPEQLLMLMTKTNEVSIVVLLDPEESKAPYEVAAQLLAYFDDVSIAKLPKKVDPGASTRKQAGKALYEAEPYKGDRISRLSSLISSSKRHLCEFYK